MQTRKEYQEELVKADKKRLDYRIETLQLKCGNIPRRESTPDFRAQVKKELVNDRFRELLDSQADMDNIHNPRRFTRHQNNLMRTVVMYVWGDQRHDIMTASYELTENIQVIWRLIPNGIDNLPAHCRAALEEFFRCQNGMMHECETTGQGYVLLCKWMQTLYDYAEHTGQLTSETQ